MIAACTWVPPSPALASRGREPEEIAAPIATITTTSPMIAPANAAARILLSAFALAPIAGCYDTAALMQARQESRALIQL